MNSGTKRAAREFCRATGLSAGAYRKSYDRSIILAVEPGPEGPKKRRERGRRRREGETCSNYEACKSLVAAIQSERYRLTKERGPVSRRKESTRSLSNDSSRIDDAAKQDAGRSSHLAAREGC